MDATIRKAIFPAAGLGTRFLPATKAQPKEMLVLVDKPVIQYGVEEAVASGVDNIVIVTGRGKNAIEDHFDVNIELESFLEQRGKKDQLAEVRKISQMIQLAYVRQGEPLGLGHAVLVTKALVGLRVSDGSLQRALRDGEELLDPFIDHPDRNRRRRVPHPAVLHDADIELHDVAILNTALAPDAVHDLVVEGYTDVAGKDAMPKAVAEERTANSRFRDQVRRGLVDLLGRNAGTNELADFFQNIARSATGQPHFVDLPCRLNGDHCTRSSIKAAISAKTTSRSRFPSTRCKAESFS